MKLFTVQIGMRNEDEMSSVTGNFLAENFSSACYKALSKYAEINSAKWVNGRLYAYNRLTKIEYSIGAYIEDGSICED